MSSGPLDQLVHVLKSKCRELEKLYILLRSMILKKNSVKQKISVKQMKRTFIGSFSKCFSFQHILRSASKIRKVSSPVMCTTSRVFTVDVSQQQEARARRILTHECKVYTHTTYYGPKKAALWMITNTSRPL